MNDGCKTEKKVAALGSARVPRYGRQKSDLWEIDLADTITAQPVRTAAPLRAWYLVAAAAAFAVMTAAILGSSLWFLNFVHVMTGSLWTGIDLFMGFVIGPIMRSVSFETRRVIIAGLIPRTLILMPTLSIITSTAGWFLAVRMGFLDFGYPEFWWVIARARHRHRAHGAGAWLFASDQSSALFRGAEGAARCAKDRALDENLCACGGGAGDHAGRDHRCHGTLRDGVLNAVFTVQAFTLPQGLSHHLDASAMLVSKEEGSA